MELLSGRWSIVSFNKDSLVMIWLAIFPIALDHLEWIEYEKLKNLRDDSQSCLL
jgi:hypothetical protein